MFCLSRQFSQLARESLEDFNRQTNAFTRILSLSSGKNSGSLAGTRVSVKENFNIAGYPSTCSSPWLESFIPTENATVVDALLDAGAMIVGKNNMDEFAMGSFCIDGIYGPSRNPHDLLKTTGGSSGGGAAAVAGGAVDVAIGSDTGGSCRVPAAWCRVLGMKPTGGRISRRGLVAYASSFDTVGILAANISLLKKTFAILQATSGHGDSITFTRNHSTSDTTTTKSLRIATVAQLSQGLSAPIKEQLDGLVGRLRHYGVEVKEVSIPSLNYALATYYVLALVEASSCLARYPSRHFAGSRDLNSQSGETVQQRLKLGTWMASHQRSPQYLCRATLLRQQITRGLENVLSSFDFILCPTSPIEAPFLKDAKKTIATNLWCPERWERALETDFDNEHVPELLADLFTVPASLARIPAISIPVGPVNFLGGMQLMARAGHDEELLEFVDTLCKLPSCTSSSTVGRHH